MRHAGLILLGALPWLACTRIPPGGTSGGGKATQTAADPVDCEALLKEQVTEVTKGVRVATGYDLANVVAIDTPAGAVIVDTGSDTERATRMRAALLPADTAVKAVILTHSHLDHVGGATAFAAAGTEIWATAEFIPNFTRQYGIFQAAEQRRGRRQFGVGVDRGFLPCSALGRLPDFARLGRTGARLPTRMFSHRKTLDFGGTVIELVAAPGETHDQLMVWLPGPAVLIAGDNFYRSFPNLYTIRGTSPRPVEQWIRSLDTARALRPKVLIPMHTQPVLGEADVQQALTNYRDAIQTLRDDVVRAANAGQRFEAIANGLKLHPDLTGDPNLAETYGRIDWSALGILNGTLGWFDGNPAALAPMAPSEAERREVEMMGGVAKVLDQAEHALAEGDHRWAIHLGDKLSRMTLSGEPSNRLRRLLALALEAAAKATPNTNARGYLAASAVEQREGHVQDQGMPEINEDLIDQLPIEVFLDRMTTLLDRTAAAGAATAIVMVFPDLMRTFHLTVRRGLLEIVEGPALPGTPPPVATLTIESSAWKRLALRQITALPALTLGGATITGDSAALAAFFSLFGRP